MGVFLAAPDPPAARRRLAPLAQAASLLLALFGWALVAIGASTHGLAAVALPGLLAAALAARAPRATLVVEALALLAALSVAGGPTAGFFLLGAAFIVVGRALAIWRSVTCR